MPDEIPDSDEESDLDPAPEETVQPPQQAEQPQHSPVVSDRLLDVNFDEFISQTQSLKDGSSQLEQTKRSTASTQKHLREALDNGRQSAGNSYDGADDMVPEVQSTTQPRGLTGQRKRAHDEVEGRHCRTGSSQSRNKRNKTYGSSSRRLASSQEVEEPCESGQTAPAEQTPFHADFDVRLSLQTLYRDDDDEVIVPRARNRPRRVVSLLEDAVPHAGKVLSTSNSSIGGYQSINLDFRGSGPGVDINANPFGALSQISVDVDADDAVQLRCIDLSTTVPLSASPRQPSRDASDLLRDSSFALEPVAETGTSVDPSTLTFEEAAETQMFTSPIATSMVQISKSTFTTASSHNPEDVAQDLGRDPVDDTAGHPEQPKSSKNRGYNPQKPRKSSIREDIRQQEDPDEPAVGLPKEQYKPRSTKSRDGTVEPDHQSQHENDELPPRKKKGGKTSIKSTLNAAEQSSPAKLPTSELNLSDEATIGLPKENYKPRPSRRISRMVVEKDAAEADLQTEQSPMIEVQSQQSKLIQVEEPTPTQKSRKGKKAKVKRAKTFAAGLLKQSAPMISDGEDDVVWMDSKPAKVKLDLPVDPLAGKGVKEEDEITVDQKRSSQQTEKRHVGATEASPAPQKTITVEIPARVEKEASEPKKRGRKRKQTAEVVEEEESDVEAEVEAEPSISITVKSHPSPQKPARKSTILQEKDTNTLLAPLPPPAAAIPSPTKEAFPTPTKPAKITHSPINPTGGKVLYRVGLSRRSAIPPLLKIVKPAVKPQAEKQDFDAEGKPVDLVKETMRKWREMGVLD